MKRIAMIPARMGSKRVPNKNLRILAGKPLIAYIIEAVKASKKFDDIYINSESDVFADIANAYGVKFYKRPEHLSSDTATNDDFAYDFIKNIEMDVLYQFLATSPFIQPKDIIEFVDDMEVNEYETLILVKNVQIECVYEQKPLNFKQKEKTPRSQDIEPIKAYACGMMAWGKNRYLQNMEKYECAYHGGDGKTGFHTIDGVSTVDIDTISDFFLAEKILESLSLPSEIEPVYYNKDLHSDIISEAIVPDILKKDGVSSGDYSQENITIVNVRNIINEKPNNESWMRRVVDTESNSCCLIAQLPGEGNRRHYHPNWNEWWYIVEGEWEFEIEGKKNIAKKDDVIFIPKNKWHQIKCVGEKMSVRLAVSRSDVAHVYKNS